MNNFIFLITPENQGNMVLNTDLINAINIGQDHTYNDVYCLRIYTSDCSVYNIRYETEALAEKALNKLVECLDATGVII